MCVRACARRTVCTVVVGVFDSQSKGSGFDPQCLPLPVGSVEPHHELGHDSRSRLACVQQPDNVMRNQMSAWAGFYGGQVSASLLCLHKGYGTMERLSVTR